MQKGVADRAYQSLETSRFCRLLMTRIPPRPRFLSLVISVITGIFGASQLRTHGPSSVERDGRFSIRLTDQLRCGSKCRVDLSIFPPYSATNQPVALRETDSGLLRPFEAQQINQESTGANISWHNLRFFSDSIIRFFLLSSLLECVA